MTSSPGNLQSSTVYHGQDKVQFGNGSVLPITHVGHTTISSPQSTFQLRNVLVVPNLHKNGISVRKFTKENSCSI
jgi:hypothetical protein